MELQEKLKRAHLVISHIQHDNRELKKYILEKASKFDEEELVTKTTPLSNRSKGKRKVEAEDIQELETLQSRIPLTRSSAKNYRKKSR